MVLRGVTEIELVTLRPEPLFHQGAVLWPARLDLQDYFDLVDAEGGRETLVADLEHVRAQAGEQPEQGRERARIVRDPAAEAEEPPGGGQPVPQQPGHEPPE